MFVAKLFFALSAVATSVSAAVLDVPRPPITSPAAGDVWTVGSIQTVTWDVSAIPPASIGQSGELLLGYLEDGSTNEHLDVDHPLAVGFPINAGALNITVPAVQPQDNYIVALLGDSANISPKFTIKN